MAATSGATTPMVRTRSAAPLTPMAPRLLTVSGLPGFSAAGPVPLDYYDDDNRYNSGRATSSRALSRSLAGQAGDGCNFGSARNFYNPARHTVYARYSTNDWANHNKANHTQSTKERATAEQLRADAWMTVRLTDHRTRVRQSDASKKLTQRVAAVEFCQDQLDVEAKLNSSNTRLLLEHLRILDAALVHSANPLLIAEECLMHREKRLGIDQVHDDVERQLTREVECIRKCQDQMRRMAERTQAQLKLNREALHHLDKDLRNKTHARGIDDRMYQLQNHSSGIAYHPGIETVDNSVSIPDSWVRFTQENINRSQRCRAASEKLCSAIETLLRGSANEMWSQFSTVNGAFNSRIRETADARNSLQIQLQRTMGEIYEAEKASALLRRAIADKEAPMKVAQTRLDERSRRVEVEICCDVPTNTLQREVHEIRSSVRTLTDRLRSLEAALTRLNQTRATLETDIRVKENSLQIDAKICMGMRRTFPMEPRVGLALK